jgi:hypothetical protein
MSLYNAYIFIRIAISKNFFPLLICGVIFTVLGYLDSTHIGQKRLDLKSLVAGAAACLIVAFLLIVCAMAPTAYAESDYPDFRALILPWWIFISEIGILGWLAGQVLFRWFGGETGGSKAVQVTGLICLIVSCAIPLMASVQVYRVLPRYMRWAEFWDARDVLLRKAGMANATRIEVIQIDRIIQDVSELKPDPKFWYNVCAARYYGVKQIIADLPGWDN